MVKMSRVKSVVVQERGDGFQVLEVDLKRPVFGVGRTKNIFRVPKALWGNWREEARWMFNSVLLECRAFGWEFMSHPDGPKLSEEHAGTPFWNAAVIAADAVQRLFEDGKAGAKFFGAGAARVEGRR